MQYTFKYKQAVKNWVDGSLAVVYCFLFFFEYRKERRKLAFFHSEGNFLFSKHERKIIPSICK